MTTTMHRNSHRKCGTTSDTMARIKHQTYHGIVYADGSFKAPNGHEYTREEMKGFIKESAHVNRIHKPMSLLYYTDVLNGLGSRWTKTIER